MKLMKDWDISEKNQSSRTMTSLSTENWNDKTQNKQIKVFKKFYQSTENNSRKNIQNNPSKLEML